MSPVRSVYVCAMCFCAMLFVSATEATFILQQEPTTSGDSFSNLQMGPTGRVAYFYRTPGGSNELRINGNTAVSAGGDIASVGGGFFMSPARYAVRVQMTNDTGAWVSGTNVYLRQNPSAPNAIKLPAGPDFITRNFSAIAMADNGDLLYGGSGGLGIALANYNVACGCTDFACYASFGNSAGFQSPTFVRGDRTVNYIRPREGQHYSARYGINTSNSGCTIDEPSDPPLPTGYRTAVETQADGSDILVRIGPGETKVSIAQTGDYFESLLGGFVSVNGTVAFGASFRDPSRGFSIGLFSSANTRAPLIANGHLVAGGTVNFCALHGVSDSGRALVRCRLDVPSAGTLPTQYNAVIVATGGSDFPPPDDPEPEDEAKWTAADGNYAQADNWDIDAVPSGDQLATFGEVGAYTVTFSGQPSVSRARVQRGDVVFAGSGYSLTTTDLGSPSLLVDTSGLLRINPGFQLQSIHAQIGTTSGPGTVDLIDSTSRWINQGRLSVGASGEGTLRMILEAKVTAGETRIGDEATAVGLVRLSDCGLNDTTLTSGNLALGYHGVGTLEVLGLRCGVASDFASVGVEPGSSGTADIQGYWGVPEGITIGDRGEAEVVVSGEGWVDAISATLGVYSNSAIGFGVGGEGVLQNNGAKFDAGNLVVGGDGLGEYAASDGAQTLVQLDLSVGQGTLGNGLVTIEGSGAQTATTLEVQGLLTVGRSGQGEVQLLDGATASVSGANIGANGSGIGTLTVDEARLEVVTSMQIGTSTEVDGEPQSLGIGRLNVRNSGEVIVADQIVVDGPDSLVTGSGLVVGTVTAKNGGQIRPGNSPGTLTIDGDFALEGGVLEIELSGLGNGDYDVLDVSGDAALADGTIRFVFDGFLPQQGDAITFLQPDGTLSSGELNYQYQGANDGFEFDVTTNNEGALVFTALNNAIDNLFTNGFE